MPKRPKPAGPKSTAIVFVRIIPTAIVIAEELPISAEDFRIWAYVFLSDAGVSGSLGDPWLAKLPWIAIVRKVASRKKSSCRQLVAWAVVPVDAI